MNSFILRSAACKANLVKTIFELGICVLLEMDL